MRMTFPHRASPRQLLTKILLLLLLLLPIGSSWCIVDVSFCLCFQARKLKARYEKKRIDNKKKRRDKLHGRGGKVNTRNARNARM